MSDFKLYKNNAESKSNYPYLLDVQSPLLNDLNTRLVIPVIIKNNMSIKILNPEIIIDNVSYVLLTQQMSSVPKKYLGELINKIEIDRAVVLTAIDFLITGY